MNVSCVFVCVYVLKEWQKARSYIVDCFYIILLNVFKRKKILTAKICLCRQERLETYTHILFLLSCAYIHIHKYIYNYYLMICFEEYLCWWRDSAFHILVLQNVLWSNCTCNFNCSCVTVSTAVISKYLSLCIVSKK